jgi:hypothetical protein
MPQLSVGRCRVGILGSSLLLLVWIVLAVVVVPRAYAGARPVSFDVRGSIPTPASDYRRVELRFINDTPWWLHKQGGSGPQFVEPGQTKEGSYVGDHYDGVYQAHYSHTQVEPSPGVSIGVTAQRHYHSRYKSEVVATCHLYVREGVRKPHCLASTFYKRGQDLWVVTVHLRTD